LKRDVAVQVVNPLDEWTQKEILLAKRYKKAIIPLLLEGEEFPIVIDLQFFDVREGRMPDSSFHGGCTGRYSVTCNVYGPVHLGARLARNASTPSLKSALV